MKVFKKLIILSALVFTAGCAPSSTFESDIQSNVPESSIIGGTELQGRPTAAAKSVVYLELLNQHKQKISFCTGTLIGPRTVLTAAHCFDRNVVRMKYFNVVFSNTVKNVNSQIFRYGDNYSVPSNYNTDSKKPKLYDHDIAIATFFGEIPKGFAPVNIDSNASANYAGLDVYVYGFGRFNEYIGDGKDSPLNSGSGHLRRGIMKVGMEYNRYPDRYFTSPESKTFLCQGDSGGPQFYHENGVLKIIGVNSASLGKVLPNGKQTCTGTSQVTKVAPFYGWILTEQKRLLNRK